MFFPEGEDPAGEASMSPGEGDSPGEIGGMSAREIEELRNLVRAFGSPWQESQDKHEKSR